MKITHTQVFRRNRYVIRKKSSYSSKTEHWAQAYNVVRSECFIKHTIPTVGNAQLIELFVFIVQSTGKLKLKPKTTTIYFHSLSHINKMDPQHWRFSFMLLFHTFLYVSLFFLFFCLCSILSWRLVCMWVCICVVYCCWIVLFFL